MTPTLFRTLRYNLFFAARKGVFYAKHQDTPVSFFTAFYNPDHEETLKIQSLKMKAPPGQVILIPPGNSFSVKDSLGSTRAAIFCYFSIWNWSDTLSLYHIPTLPPGKKVNQHLMRLINQSVDCYQQMISEGDSIPLTTKRNRIGFAMLETILSVSTEKPNSDKILTDMKRLHPALQHIEENLHHKLPLRELAQKVNLSLPHFNKLFRQTMNIPPKTYLRSRILQHAADLLAEEKLTHSQIADRLGYADPFQFSKQFKKHFGESPQNYKKLSKAQLSGKC